MYGWVGKILRVDLTSGKMTETPTNDYVPRLIGGRGIGAMVYWEEVLPTCKAFDSENALIFMTGPATGTLAPTSSKTYIGCKSPVLLNECYSYSCTGGHWGPELKFAGYDGIIVKGKSQEPVYLWINDGRAEIRSAKTLWKTTTRYTYSEINRLHGPKTRVMVIGPAGENLCRGAIISNDAVHATGMSGAGAIMGSKKLKAIAVNGSGSVKVAEPKELLDLAWYYSRLLNRKPGEDGYPAVNKTMSYYIYHDDHLPYESVRIRSLAKPRDPSDYFSKEGLDDPNYLMSEAEKSGTIKRKWAGCYGCPVCCIVAYSSNDMDIHSGASLCAAMMSWTVANWKVYDKWVGIPDIWLSRFADELGLSVSNIGGYWFFWFFELVNRGIITKDDLGGLNVDDKSRVTIDFIKGLLEMVAFRRGLGDQLAEGQERFLKQLSEKNPEVKEIYDAEIQNPGYYIQWGPRRMVPTTFALTNLTDIRAGQKASGGFQKSGMDVSGLPDEHQKEIFKRSVLKFFGSENALDVPGEPKTWKGKVPSAILLQNMSINMDCVTYCSWANCPPFFSRYTTDYLGDPTIGSKVYSAVTGIDTTNEEMIAAMEPIFNIERCIHVREGRRRIHDTPNNYTFSMKEWNWTNIDEFNEVLSEYYIARGWDVDTAIPRKSTLEKLGLKKISNELEKKYKVPMVQ